MNPKSRSRSNKTSDYTGIRHEFDKVREEFDKPFKEFEYEMNELDRINAEFEESMKIPEIEEYEKDFEQDFSFSNDPGRHRRHINMLIRSCGITPKEFYKKIHDRIRKSKHYGLSRY